MAWLSVGTSNNDLIAKMKENGLFPKETNDAYSESILEAFQNTDRGDFVLPNDRMQAYRDRPYKNSFVHISCPHIYVTVLQALQLQPNQSFLNVGSGSGYLSCLASYVLGEKGLSHGIDINEQVVEHSRKCLENWRKKMLEKFPPINSDPIKVDPGHYRHSKLTEKIQDRVSIVHGNCFDIDVSHSNRCCKYDRIYVGAGCPDRYKSFFYSMLLDGGVLILPINEKNLLMKITKVTGNIYTVKAVSTVSFAPLLLTSPSSTEATLNATLEEGEEEEQEEENQDEMVISPVIASIPDEDIQHMSVILPNEVYTNRSSSRCSVKLPPVVWEPEKGRHMQFPKDFREIIFLILLASSFDRSKNSQINVNDTDTSDSRMEKQDHECTCNKLPIQVWYYIFSFANRNWFVSEPTQVQSVQNELYAERTLRKHTESRNRHYMMLYKSAQRERDLYKSIVRRMGLSIETQNSTSTTSWQIDPTDISDDEIDDIDEQEEAQDDEEDEEVVEDEDEDEDEEDEEDEEEMEEEEDNDEEAEEENDVTRGVINNVYQRASFIGHVVGEDEDFFDEQEDDGDQHYDEDFDTDEQLAVTQLNGNIEGISSNLSIYSPHQGATSISGESTDSFTTAYQLLSQERGKDDEKSDEDDNLPFHDVPDQPLHLAPNGKNDGINKRNAVRSDSIISESSRLTMDSFGSNLFRDVSTPIRKATKNVELDVELEDKIENSPIKPAPPPTQSVFLSALSLLRSTPLFMKSSSPTSKYSTNETQPSDDTPYLLSNSHPSSNKEKADINQSMKRISDTERGNKRPSQESPENTQFDEIQRKHQRQMPSYGLEKFGLNDDGNMSTNNNQYEKGLKQDVTIMEDSEFYSTQDSFQERGSINLSIDLSDNGREENRDSITEELQFSLSSSLQMSHLGDEQSFSNRNLPADFNSFDLPPPFADATDDNIQKENDISLSLINTQWHLSDDEGESDDASESSPYVPWKPLSEPNANTQLLIGWHGVQQVSEGADRLQQSPFASSYGSYGGRPRSSSFAATSYVSGVTDRSTQSLDASPSISMFDASSEKKEHLVDNRFNSERVHARATQSPSL